MDLSPHSTSDVFVDLAAGDCAGDDFAKLHCGFLGSDSLRASLFFARAQRRENDARRVRRIVRRISVGNRKDSAEAAIRARSKSRQIQRVVRKEKSRFIDRNQGGLSTSGMRRNVASRSTTMCGNSRVSLSLRSPFAERIASPLMPRVTFPSRGCTWYQA